ncbi:MAG: helix-turn-helix domain-containing protein [Rickettsiales bacterium]|jgi:hypothetical protein|nr:helix-turn-helix domain-containing protein [Rickettsiales bacterium]
MIKGITDLRQEFEDAPMSAPLNSKVVAAFINKSISWLNIKATYGGSIPYTKLGNSRLYSKKDVLDWLERNGQKIRSTSEYRREVLNG